MEISKNHNPQMSSLVGRSSELSPAEPHQRRRLDGHQRRFATKEEKDASESMPSVTRPKRRLDMRERIVKLNAPRRTFSDGYYHLLNGSWWRVAAVFVISYFMTNLFFAAIYMLDPGGVENAQSFLDHFFFSVQTLSTIGYGGLAPSTLYAQTWVMLEAMVGMLFVAVWTGIMFAKASRPTTQIIFSDRAVISQYNGLPTLMFRAGNLRGNEIAQAEISVNALLEDVNPEGVSVKRLYGVPLLRSNSPVFSLSWLVMHPITDESALACLRQGEVQDALQMIVVTLTGHDATFGQTVYARKLYYPEDIVYGERLVDVMTELPDDRLQIDFKYFHATEPDPYLGAEPQNSQS